MSDLRSCIAPSWSLLYNYTETRGYIPVFSEINPRFQFWNRGVERNLKLTSWYLLHQPKSWLNSWTEPFFLCAIFLPIFYFLLQAWEDHFKSCLLCRLGITLQSCHFLFFSTVPPSFILDSFFICIFSPALPYDVF